MIKKEKDQETKVLKKKKKTLLKNQLLLKVINPLLLNNRVKAVLDLSDIKSLVLEKYLKLYLSMVPKREKSLNTQVKVFLLRGQVQKKFLPKKSKKALVI
jgi:hypothetical protein